MSAHAENKFAVMPADALFDSRLSHAQVRCLGFICYYGAQKKNGCWPSYDTIAEHMKSDRRNVMRYIKALIDSGYILKESRHRTDGSQTSNTYRVNFDIEIGDAQVSTQGGKNDHPPVPQSDHPAGGKNDHPKEQENLTGKENNKKSVKITIGAWEQKVGSPLCIEQVASWVKENHLKAEMVKALITEFRDVVLANGNVYADFTSAFKNYLRRGYLSKTMAAITIPQEEQEYIGRREKYDRGLSL